MSLILISTSSLVRYIFFYYKCVIRKAINIYIKLNKYKYCIIGVGAYVSPAMAAGAHCVVEPPSEGLEYTWYVFSM